MAVTPANKIVRGDDLTTVAQEIDKYFQRKATGKGLSTNDYTTEEKTKLAGIEAGAQVNVKPDWNAASGTSAEILNKPTIPAAVQPATVAPLMDGTAAVGSSTKYAKEDHVHPTDSTRAPIERPVFVDNAIVSHEGTKFLIDPISGVIQFYGSSTSNETELVFPDSGSSEITIELPENSGTVALVSDVTSAVANKADKSTTLAGYGITNAYTKTEVDTAITNAMKGGYTVVATLPTASANTMGKIYLVPLTDTDTNNVKEEYVTWLDGSTYKWERLGTTQIDLSDYEERLTAAEITTLLNL